jgi:alpha-tubulin suppressor-like RCC1 family protein
VGTARFRWLWSLLVAALLLSPAALSVQAASEVSAGPATQSVVSAAAVAPPLRGGAFIETVSTGGGFACGLRSDGSLSCWGLNPNGETVVPALPAALTYVQVSAGTGDGCAIRSDGSLVCWGRNLYGGNNVPPLPPGVTYTQVSSGEDATCAIRSDGSLVCWGFNFDGLVNVPVLPAGVTYTQVDTLGYHACAVRSDGGMVCWGFGGSMNVVPALPAGLNYSQASVGDYHSCGLRSDGSIVCFGGNAYGQTTVPALPPGLVYTQVDAGVYHTCALRSDGNVLCWGLNWRGNTDVAPLPAGQAYTQISASGSSCALRTDHRIVCWGSVEQAPGYTQVGAGYAHTCALLSDGTVDCWGKDSDDGQATPPALPTGLTYDQVSAGYFHSCALRSNGSVICWGWNGAGGTNVPALPAGLTYTQTSAGGYHSCGLRSDGSVVCWGDNGFGQTEVPDPSPLKYTAVDAEQSYTCGLRSDGSLVCWGDGSMGQTQVPALPAGMSYTQVQGGYYHVCALRSDGNVLCWGRNVEGQTTVPALPANVRYTQVGAGDEFSCASRTDGQLVCWGWNEGGQLVVPALPAGLTYGQVSAGGQHACSVRSDQSLVCWGTTPGYDYGQSRVPSFGTDTTPPVVNGISLVGSSPTNAASVDFKVTFSEFVVGVTAGDFAITASPLITGAHVEAVKGSGATYVVTVDTGSGDGWLRLDVSDDDSIRDVVNQPLGGIGEGNGRYTAGPSYQVNRTVRIEAGGATSLVDQAGNTWLADTGFTGGTKVDRGSISISNTPDPAIYRTERYGMSSFAYDVPNGIYAVYLHFAETYAGITGPGQRVFGVNVEGVAIDNIDIFAQAGGRNRALVKAVLVAVADGRLNMSFSASVNNAAINGIEIIPNGAIRVEAGGSANLTDRSGNLWLSDRGFSGGSVVDRGAIAIGNTADPGIYRTERYGMTSFTSNVPSGAYTVKLHFAETYTGITGPGQRVFSVNVEGVAVGNVDVFAQAGGRNIALVKSVQVMVRDGQLNVTFAATTNNVEINGIEIVPIPLPVPLNG